VRRQKDLVQVAEKAGHSGNIAIVGLDLRNVLQLVRGYRERVVNSIVDVGHRALAAVGVGKRLHGLDDAGDAANPVNG